jgi:ethanolamine ammonia-lyase small subunit
VNEEPALIEDPWSHLRRFTDARIALGRSGTSLPTREVLSLRLSQARARDAVARELDAEAMGSALGAFGLGLINAKSRCLDKAEYLRRPDLGRRLSDESREELAARPPAERDLAIVVADGLSSVAAERQAVPLLASFLPLVSDLSIAPICLATLARVALGDEVGSLLRAKAVVILLGERPGLGSPDSLGAYLTFAPAVGVTDGRRNCISNIRPAGLAPPVAASKLEYLLREALRRSLSGFALKDEQGETASARKASRPPFGEFAYSRRTHLEASADPT